jgi:methyl-accepting chemotaxis protein
LNEVGLVDHAARLASGDAHEHPLASTQEIAASAQELAASAAALERLVGQFNLN